VINAIIISRVVLYNTPYVYCILYCMSDHIPPRRPIGPPPRGITQSDVSHAADSLLRAGDRPTIEKIRAKLGRGSPNTINPMLDAWWKTLSARLDSGPASFHRLPEVVAHVAEALWMQALEAARSRVRTEHKTTERQNADKEQTLEVRSHVLTLREGELDSRLRDRDRTIEELNSRLRDLAGSVRKEQATRELLLRQIERSQSAGAAKRRQPRANRAVRKLKLGGPRKPSVRKKSKAIRRRLR
jgi:Plasmid replication region DNA-binding N-term